MALRYERKYYISNEKLDTLRERLKPFVNPDVHLKENEIGLSQYTVRSIYYDTPTMEFYYEKKEGLENRNKFRIRVYDQFKPGDVAFLEIKRKLGNRIKKHRATLPAEKTGELLKTGDIEKYIIADKSPKVLDDASKFLYYYYAKSLKPVNLVVYEREAFHGKFDPGVRITFDKNVRTTLYPKLSELYSEARNKAITPGYFIVEIKYFETMPVWAHSIVEEFKLRLEAISKYSTGLDIHYPYYSRMRYSPVGLSRTGFNDL
jgi:hypothetical protein